MEKAIVDKKSVFPLAQHRQSARDSVRLGYVNRALCTTLPSDVLALVSDYCRERERIDYSVDEMIERLTWCFNDDEHGENSLVCNSSSNAGRVVQRLQAAGHLVTRRILGYTTGRKRLCRWIWGMQYNWGLKRIATCIRNGRLLAAEVEKEAISRGNFGYGEHRPLYDFEQIRAAWSGVLSRNEIMELIREHWGQMLEDDKYTPFDNCNLANPIVLLTVTDGQCATCKTRKRVDSDARANGLDAATWLVHFVDAWRADS